MNKAFKIFLTIVIIIIAFIFLRVLPNMEKQKQYKEAYEKIQQQRTEEAIKRMSEKMTKEYLDTLHIDWVKECDIKFEE